MTTLTLSTKQVSPITFVPAGSRITSDGNGSIEWTPGSPTDAANSPNWKTWKKGSSAGYMDTLRPMSIRATATGAMTVTIEEGRGDKYGEDAYFDADYAQYSVGASGNTVLVGPDGRVHHMGEDKFKSNSGILLSDCSTHVGATLIGAGVTAETVAVSNSYKIGNSIKLTIPVGVTGSITLPAFTGRNIPNNLFALVFEQISKDKGRAGAIYWGGAGLGNSWRADPFMNRCGLQTWSMAVADMSVNSGTPTVGGVTTFRFLVNNTAGSEPYVCYLHGVHGAPASRPSVNIMIDDGIESAYYGWSPLLAKYNYLASFSIIKDLIGQAGYMTAAQLDELYEAGHELCPHGQFALSSFATIDLAKDDIAKNADYLLNRGYIRGSDYYVYPNGVFDYSATDVTSIHDYLVSRGMRAAYIAANMGVSYGALPIKKAGKLKMPRIYLDATHSAATALGLIDGIVAAGRSCTIMAHNLVASGASGDAVNLSDAIALLDGLKTRELAGSLQVVPSSVLHDRLGL